MSFFETINKIVIQYFLNQSDGNRFFCEKQIQFRLGTEIFKKLNIEPHFEKTMCSDKREYIDLYFEQDDKKIGIEIKYKTTNKGSAEYRRHGAQLNAFAGCLYDISRLEKFARAGNITKGYFILITNDSTYWPVNSKNGLYFPEKATIQNNFNAHWKSCPVYCKNISLHGEYNITWIGQGPFKCLIIPV